MLLQRGVEINKQKNDGFTALMLAASNGHERVVELMIRRGAVSPACGRGLAGRGSVGRPRCEHAEAWAVSCGFVRACGFV